MATTTTYQPRLKTLYREKLVPEMKTELQLDNVHQVPKLEKIVVSVGIGKHKDDKHYHEVVANTLRKITGQQPVDRMAKKSIATFKIRKGMNRVGVSVTLRGARMYAFLEKLLNISLPRTKDFRGLPSTSADGMGGYSIGIKEHSIFPETSEEELKDVFGLGVTVVTNLKAKDQTKAFLELLGFPIKKDGAAK